MVDTTRTYARHEDASVVLPAAPEDLFAFLDDHRVLASHMGSRRSPRLGGGEMRLELDAGQGRELGSHIRMTGTAFGLRLSVDEVVVERTPPRTKTWQTVEQRLVVIGPYAMGYRIDALSTGSRLTVWIDYSLPEHNRWLGVVGGGSYARWCVRQMTDAARQRFAR